MTRFEKVSVWIASFLVGVTGVVYGWMKYLVTSDDPFSIINHPLQPLFLKLHILLAPLLLFAVGMIAVRHIWKHFRSGTGRGRASGVTTMLTLVPMVGSGYLIQVLTGEHLLLAMVAAHIGFGLLYLIGIAAHQWSLARRKTPKPSAANSDL